MDKQSLGLVNITVDIIGHDSATYTLILQLPSGAIVPATIARGNFNKHVLPLLENPPKITETRTTAIQIKDKTSIEADIQEAVNEAEAVKKAIEEEMNKDDIWWDVDAMFQEIRWHARANGRLIVLDERDIVPPRLAFKCTKTDTTWSMDIKFLNEHLNKISELDEMNKSKAFNLRKCISTIEGRQRLVESLNNAIK